jgi:3'(2'), 5'-bisphosphate nucleotidase
LEFFEKEIAIEHKDDKSPLTEADLGSNQIINEFLKPTGIPVLSEENKIQPYNIRNTWKIFWIVDPLDGTKEFIQKSPEYTVNIALIEKNQLVFGVVYVPAQRLLYYSNQNSKAFKVNVGLSMPYNELIRKSISLPIVSNPKSKVTVIASKSHMSKETVDYISELEKYFPGIELLSAGSSLKLCLLAEGIADIYPRFGPTMEWDIAAGHAIINSANCKLIDSNTGEPLKYNKMDLHNPSFIAFKMEFKETVKKLRGR